MQGLGLGDIPTDKTSLGVVGFYLSLMVGPGDKETEES